MTSVSALPKQDKRTALPLLVYYFQLAILLITQFIIEGGFGLSQFCPQIGGVV
jgi:hypothetical protein